MKNFKTFVWYWVQVLEHLLSRYKYISMNSKNGQVLSQQHSLPLSHLITWPLCVLSHAKRQINTKHGDGTTTWCRTYQVYINQKPRWWKEPAGWWALVCQDVQRSKHSFPSHPWISSCTSIKLPPKTNLILLLTIMIFQNSILPPPSHQLSNRILHSIRILLHSSLAPPLPTSMVTVGVVIFVLYSPSGVSVACHCRAAGRSRASSHLCTLHFQRRAHKCYQL